MASSVSEKVELWVVDVLNQAVVSGLVSTSFVATRNDRASWSKAALQTLRVVIYTAGVVRLRSDRGNRRHTVQIAIAVMQTLGVRVENNEGVFKLNEIDNLKTLCEEMANLFAENGHLLFPQPTFDVVIQPDNAIDPVMDLDRMAAGQFAAAINIEFMVEEPV